MNERRPPSTPERGSPGGWSETGDPVDAPEPDGSGPRYVVGALLGRGGMGEVRAARDTRLGRDVALEELAPERLADVVARARLAREAPVPSRLDHPGIVSVYDVGTRPDGRPYYAMRLVRGRTLGELAAATPPDERRRLVRHVLAAAEAVAVAYEAGRVHRDLKPANLLVGAHDELPVVGGGLATPTALAASRWAGLPAPPPTGRVGTGPYLSPEQARGEPADPRDDVWAMAVTLREVLGAPPPELAAVIARVTHPDRARRYPDAGAFAAELLRWFEGRRVEAHAHTPVGILRRAVQTWRVPLTVGGRGLLALAIAVGWGGVADRPLAPPGGRRRGRGREPPRRHPAPTGGGRHRVR